MNRRRLCVTAVGGVALAVALVGALLAGNHNAARGTALNGAGLAFAGAQGSSATPAASRGATRAAFQGPSVGQVTPVAINRDLRTIPWVQPKPIPQFELESESGTGQGAAVPAPPPIPAQAAAMPAPIQNFAGLDFTGGGSVGYPPDPVGDVGPNNYIQAVNTAFAIYNKTGTLLASTSFAAIWSGISTTPCATNHFGDPTVVYDPIGDRWIIADFSWADLMNGPYYECILVSQTSNPIGSYWAYAVRSDDAAHPYFMDYPKMGIWPDGLYISYNAFDCLDAGCSSATNQGSRVQALSRTAIEAGASTFIINFDARFSGCPSVDPCYFGLLPSNMRGTLPPAGRENLVAASDFRSSPDQFHWRIWKFHADFVTPGNSTFTGPTDVTQGAYSKSSFPRITTPFASAHLDSLASRLMMQNQYRNISGTESLWLTHTVPSPGPALPEMTQWAQINVTGGVVNTTPVQEQIYGNLGNDGVSRWMSSLAVDRAGNMALGYSAASGTVNPGIRYNGRLKTDPLSTLPQGETTLVSGGGNQTNNCGSQVPCHRWGDYSAMSVDPTDDCTFWYTNEYYTENGNIWRTRVGSFKFPTQNCGPPTAVSVARFKATRTRPGIALSWRTGSESEILGFNLYRSATMQGWQKVNRTLVTARRSGEAAGAAYRFVDRTARRGKPYNYRLQLVSLKGVRSWYGVGAVGMR